MKQGKRQAKADTPPQERPDDQATLDTEETAQEADVTLEQVQQQLHEAEEQRDEYLQMAQRVQADFDNFRRRNNAVRSEAFEDGAASFIKTILPVCDNLERALAAECQDEALADGVRLVQKQLMDVLEKRGVTVIDRVGEPFDPNLEDAVTQAGPEEGEPGTVASVLLKGYRMGDKVLRHAMVRVVVA